MKSRFGRYTRKAPGQMNKLEASYAQHLKELQQFGQIAGFFYESMKFKLADKTYYTPDFLVLMTDGFIELHEVKGFWEDDARVKIKVAADKFPFKFKAIKKTNGQWVTEDF